MLPGKVMHFEAAIGLEPRTPGMLLGPAGLRRRLMDVSVAPRVERPVLGGNNLTVFV
jgi:hypothetical protein